MNDIITADPKINKLKLSVYEAVSDGEISKRQGTVVLCEIGRRDMELFESATNPEIDDIYSELDYIALEYATSEILLESSSMYIYEAEVKDAEKKSKSLLSRLINAIKALFTKLKNWITGKKVEPPDGAPESCKVALIPKKLKEFVGKAFKHTDRVIEAAAGTAAVAATTVAVVQGVKKSNAKKELNATKEELDSTKEELNRTAATNKYKGQAMQTARRVIDSQKGHIADQNQKISEMGNELKTIQDDLKKAMASDQAKETILKNSYKSAIAGYKETLDMCEKKMDEINKALLNPNTHLNAELTTQLKSSFSYLQTLYTATQKSIKEIMTACGMTSDKDANKMASKKAKSMVSGPLDIDAALSKVTKTSLDSEYGNYSKRLKKLKDKKNRPIGPDLTKAKNMHDTAMKQLLAQKEVVANLKGSGDTDKIKVEIEKLQELIDRRDKALASFDAVVDRIA